MLLLICVFSFSLVSLPKHLSILFIISRNPLLVILLFIFFIVFLFSISFISSLILVSFFFCTEFGLSYFFPSSLKQRVKAIYLESFLLLNVSVYCYKISSQNCFCYITQVLVYCAWIKLFKDITIKIYVFQN